MLSLALPVGTKEYLVMVVGKMPKGADPLTNLSAEMSITKVGDPVAAYTAADWLPDENGWGKMVDNLAAGEYDVRLRLTYGLEKPLLGPARLIVATYV